MLFGDVLADAVTAADGDLVLKMDDDDWYGPDFVADLLLARAYSGAEMVGTPAEMHYLVERGRHRPSRPPGPSSTRHFVAGGTMLVERGLLREVGSFRSVRQLRRRPADRRRPARPAPRPTAPTASGTCCAATPPATPGRSTMDYLLDPVRVAEIRPGFAPSRLLEYDESERPSPG